MGEAEEKRKLAVVFDANVVIASLIKESSLNRYIVALTPIIYSSKYLSIYQLLLKKPEDRKMRFPWP